MFWGSKILIEGGTISGNIATNAKSLYIGTGEFPAQAQYGYFTDDEWTSLGNLGTTNDDIIVVDGVLQQ